MKKCFANLLLLLCCIIGGCQKNPTKYMSASQDVTPMMGRCGDDLLIQLDYRIYSLNDETGELTACCFTKADQI